MSSALLLSLLALQAAPAPAAPATEAGNRGELHMSTPGAAEAFERAIGDARGAGLQRPVPGGGFSLVPFATVSALGAWGEPKEVVSLYAYRTMARERVVAVRRFDMLRNEVKWAASSQCAGLDQAVEGLERVGVPAVDVPLFGEHESDGLGSTVKDGVSYTLWIRSPAWDGGGETRHLSATYSSFSALEAWYGAVTAAARDCWSPTPPDAP
ncbi:MAG: hypothetical protein EON89_11010 [Brevundimonas sp.]|nr:MAG: hypothetical protein EON89_11010 [Brevundimonas sp.]